MNTFSQEKLLISTKIMDGGNITPGAGALMQRKGNIPISLIITASNVPFYQ
jgi:hypothetical protein